MDGAWAIVFIFIMVLAIAILAAVQKFWQVSDSIGRVTNSAGQVLDATKTGLSIGNLFTRGY